MSLTELANRFGSDKGTTVGAPPHRYTHLYDLVFWSYREQPINLLEIGLAVGGPEVGGPIKHTVASPSVQMWLEFFPNAHVFGFDISDFSHIVDPRFTFVQGDAGSQSDMQWLAAVASAFHIILDDGSHASYHQQLAFKLLFPKLAPAGIYVIEDLQWQSPAYEGILPRVPKTSQFLNSYFERGLYTDNLLFTSEDMSKILSQVASFSSFPAFDGSASPTKLIVFRKRCGTCLTDEHPRLPSNEISRRQLHSQTVLIGILLSSGDYVAHQFPTNPATRPR